MPFIDIKLAKQATRKQEHILSDGLAKAITLIPGKSSASLMLNVSSDNHLYKGSDFMEYGAFANVVLKSGCTREDCIAFNKEFFRILEEDLKIPENNIYIQYTFCDDFAVKGTFL